MTWQSFQTGDGDPRTATAFLMPVPEPWKAGLTAAVAVREGGAMRERAFAAGRNEGVGAVSSETSLAAL